MENSSKNNCRLIAFYLPQYHPIPENDKWWGKGFTEWRNVVRGRPKFEGHYQPRLPADLGFYDLRLPEVREEQANLARMYGIYGFCYHHYWFNGRRVLNLPFDEVLTSGKPDFPFCLSWANEDWRRNWDGHTGEILIKQEYNDEDDLYHIRWLINAFKDTRYIKIGGKPLFLVYRVQSLPNPLKTSEIWRHEVNRAGFDDIFLVEVESHGYIKDPKSLGFDASVEFPPHHLHCTPEISDQGDSLYDYKMVMQSSLEQIYSQPNRFPCLLPGWDNTARRKYIPTIIIKNSSPELYEKWLRRLVEHSQTKPEEERLVFINAWNEWAEGTYLEPDLKFGRFYLEATRKALTVEENSPGHSQRNRNYKQENIYPDEEVDFYKSIQYEEIKSIIKGLNSRIDILEDKLNECNKRWETFTQSSSWKIISFLRRIAQFLCMRKIL